jgi:hypothetical protein
MDTRVQRGRIHGNNTDTGDRRGRNANLADPLGIGITDSAENTVKQEFS